eukprot:gene16340-19437_t
MTSLRGLVKKGDLEITLLDTKGIKLGDIFCIIDLPPNKPFKTHLFKGPDPKFNEKFTLDLMTLNDDEVLIVLKEQKVAGSKFIGQVQIPIKALALQQPTEEWYFLTDRPLKAGKKPKVVSGSIRVMLSFVHRHKKSKKSVIGIDSLESAFYEPTAPSGQTFPLALSDSSSQSSLSSNGSASPMYDRTGSSLSLYSAEKEDEYAREEAVIIDATLKDKETMVMRQLAEQKDMIKHMTETIRKKERETGDSSAVAKEKMKVQQMAKDIAEMERLVVQQSTPELAPVSMKEQTGTMSRRSSTLYKTLNKADRLLASSTLAQANNTSTPSKIDISSFSFDKPSPATLGKSNAPATTGGNDVEVKLRMIMLELENERKLKETAQEKNRILAKENERLEKDIERERLVAAHAGNKDAARRVEDLTLKLRLSESESNALVQEKAILMEKARLFEKESEKLEKEIEHERTLRKKETERKDVERDEVKRLTKELEIATNKVKVVQIELDSQRDQNTVLRDKKAALDKEMLRYQSAPTASSSMATSAGDASKQREVEYKLKMVELELDGEKRSKELANEKVRHYERELEKTAKTIGRLEAEIGRFEQQIASYQRISAERDKAVADRDRLQSLEETRSKRDKENLNIVIEDRLNEMVKLLINMSSKPDGASLGAAIGENTPLGRKIKDIGDKVAAQNLKNKEMELQLMEMRQEKIQRMMLRQQDMSDEDMDFDSEDEDSGNGRRRPNGAKGGAFGMMQNDQISILVNKLDKLDKLEDFMRKLDTMKSMGPAGDMGGSGKRSHADIKAELATIQKIIMSDKGSEKEREEANIRFEKVFQELSQTEEYKRELVAIQEEKRRVNEPLNLKALQKLMPTYNAAAVEKNPQLKDRLRDFPELTLIGMDPKAIMSKHQNDFQQFFLANLTMDELRAIRASLPKWRGDQRRQAEWTLSLEDKIEQYTKNPPPPPRAPPKPKLSAITKKPIVVPVASGDQSSLMGELLRRRRRVD